MVHLNEALTNHQSHPDPFVIDLCCALQLAKHAKQLANILSLDSASIVDHHHFELLFIFIVGHQDIHIAF